MSEESLSITKGTLSLRSLFLDPNNFRFRDAPGYEPVDKGMMTQPEVQARTRKFISGRNQENLRDLIDSFKKNGFLPVDQIQVQRIGETGKFFVVEGNRRVACLKYLQERYERDGDTLGKLDPSLFSKIPVVYYEDADKSHHLVLMALKHISGNKKWPPINQGKLIRTLLEEGMSTDHIHKAIGVSKREITITLNTLSLIDLYQESEFGDQFESDKYTLFKEVIRKPALRQWLGWDEETRAPSNRNNLLRLFSWMSREEEEEWEDEDSSEPSITVFGAVISTTDQVRELSKIIDDEKALKNLDTTRSLSEATLSSDVLVKDRVKNALFLIGQEINTVFGNSRTLSAVQRAEISDYTDKLRGLLELGSSQNVSASSAIHYLAPSGAGWFESLNVKHFRKFDDFSIDNIRRVNIFAGKNNCGKTSLLECVKLLCSLSDPEAFVSSIETRAKVSSNQAKVEWFLEQVPEAHLSGVYAGAKVSLGFSKESSPPDDSNHYLKSVGFWGEVDEDKFSSRIHFFKKYPQQVVGRTEALCPSIYSTPFSDLDSELLKTCHSQSLKEGSKQVVVDFIRENVDPDVQSIELNDDGRFTVVHKRISPNPDLTSFGEGFQRIFKMGLLFAGAQNGVVIIDEFENGVHASLLPNLVKLVDKLSRLFNVQVFASTHSKECVDAFVLPETVPNEDLSCYSFKDFPEGLKCFSFSGERLHELVDRVDFDLRGNVKS